VCGTIKWRLNNKSAKIRQQAADLVARIAPVMKACDEEQLLGHLGEWASAVIMTFYTVVTYYTLIAW